mgnify:CR=1 FL=1
MNVVLIITDTQPTWFVGCYGNGEACGTAALDAMATRGVRFDRAYTTCPLCTPARSAIFTGVPPSRNGAFANELTPGRAWPYLGEIAVAHGIEYAHIGKWHLDGAGYNGSGLPDGAAPDEWWYDKTRYVAEVGEERARELGRAAGANDADRLDELGLREDELWGHRVASRAERFLDEWQRRADGDADRPFFLVVSFDEPHGPFVCPPEYFRRFRERPLATPPNFDAPLHGKPRMQQRQRAEFPTGGPDAFTAERTKHMACNAWIDSQIGRVLDAVRRTRDDDTLVIFTSDHGDQNGSHGLRSKGPMMYEESIRVPMLMEGPGVPADVVEEALASHIDLFPTIAGALGLELADGYPGHRLVRRTGEGVSYRAPDRDAVFVEFERFGVYHHGNGGFYPIRTIVTRDAKLTVNLLDTDEFYDLAVDPTEEHNLLAADAAPRRAHDLLDRLAAHQDAIADPLRGDAWRARPWARQAGDRTYFSEPSGDAPPRPVWRAQPEGVPK